MKKLLLNFLIKIKIIRMHKAENKKINDKRRKELVKSVHLTREQINITQKFFKENLGKKISLKWHKLYYAISGVYDYRYFPEYYYSSDLETHFNPFDYVNAYGDKNNLDLLFGKVSDIELPKILFFCISGNFFDKNRNEIAFDDLVNSLSKLSLDVFCKPTINTNSGKNCFKCDFSKMNRDEIVNLVKSLGKDFAIQEVLVNQEDIKKINPSSINTFRIITYILNNKFYSSPISLRFGVGNVCVDNIHSGGYFVGVSDEGDIISNPINEFGDKMEVHPITGVKFKGYHIANANKLISAAIKLHKQVPQLKFINWDLTLNEEGNVVLVEANTIGGSCWIGQMANGQGIFGENSAEILKLIKNKR